MESLSKVLDIFKDYDEFISSIGYNDSPDDFSLQIELCPNESCEYYSAYLDVFSDGSVSVHDLKATYECDSTNVIDIDFLHILSDMGRLWYNTIKR